MIRLLIWNIRAGGGVRRHKILATVQRLNPDLCGFSEFRGTSASLWLAGQLAELGFAHQRMAKGNVEARQNVVFVASRIPLRRLHTRMSPEEPGRWLSVRVYAERPFNLGLLHIPNEVTGRKAAFMESVLDVAGLWQNQRALIAGDTNSGRPEVDEQNAVFGPHYTTWFDGFEKLRWQDSFRALKGDTREYTWYSPQKGNGFRIDQAFASQPMWADVLDTRHVWAMPSAERREEVSDHAAVVVDLR